MLLVLLLGCVLACVASTGAAPDTIPHDTIPPGTACERKVICDDRGEVCSIVCARGSVTVPRWLDNALSLQRKLARKRPLCEAQWPGTHNSAITLADGYGNEDFYYQSLLRYVDKSWVLRTHDQYFSLTDQLNLGVRLIELDTHWVLDELRLAHCGFSIPDHPIDKLIALLKEISKDLGLNYTIDWDTETIGCDPSLSSIPVRKQRSLAAGFEEISAWINDATVPGRSEEFLMLYFDDQPDLKEWGKVGLLMKLIHDHFGDMLYTPVDYEREGNRFPPSVDDMVRRGKRVLFLSRTDYGGEMNSTVFFRNGPQLCGWQEPHLGAFKREFPSCTVELDGQISTHIGSRQILRPETSEIVYGPIHPNNLSTHAFLDEKTIPALTTCNTNFASCDLLTVDRAAAFVWTFAEGEPSAPCAAQSVTDGRWYGRDCGEMHRVACFQPNAPFWDRLWNISFALFSRDEAHRACIDSGLLFASPSTAYENRWLLEASHASQVADFVWLGVDAAPERFVPAGKVQDRKPSSRRRQMRT
jgi:hypothetical protein